MSELHCLADSRGPLNANVIFIHGLGGDARRTWQAATEAASLWPCWLAEDIDGVAVWSVGYEAAVSRWRGHALHFTDRARNVLRRLVNEPRLGEGRIVLIGHSLGGLIIKQMLLLLESERKHSEPAASLRERIDKVAFLATPHTGSDLADRGDRWRIVFRPSAATACLVRNDPNLRHLNEDYRDLASERGLFHLILRETKPTSIFGMLVKPDSADPGLPPARPRPVDKNHWTIVKPPSREDEVYLEVQSFVAVPFVRPVPQVEQMIERVLAGQDSLKTDSAKIVDLLEGAKRGIEIVVAFDSKVFRLGWPGSDVAAAQTDLDIPWRTLDEAVTLDDYNLLDALRWNFGLSKTLHGRDGELKQILDWAQASPTVPSARLVTGDGGVGKTRLAAAAATALRQQGWQAGFLRAGVSTLLNLTECRGLLIVLDYPEETPNLTRRLIQTLADTPSAGLPIRVLFLSRRDFAHWESEVVSLQGRFGRHPVAAPAALAEQKALELIFEAARVFAEHAGQPSPNLDRATVWLSQNPLHRLPLFALAAAVHAVVAPNAAFGIEGGEILRDLAQRERSRVRRTSVALGIGSLTLERLLALGILADGLKPNIIEELVKAGVSDGSSDAAVVHRIADTPWWRRGALIRLQPDRVAAAFLDAVLFDAKFPQGDQHLPLWLSIALQGAERDFGDRLGRVLFDLDMSGVAHAGAAPLEACLIAMLEQEPTSAFRFAAVASSQVPYSAAVFAEAVGAILLRLLKDQPGPKARILSSLANYRTNLGRHEDALKAAEEAVAICRALASVQPEPFNFDLALALNTFATVLGRLGRFNEAIDAVHEATEINRNLARTGAQAFVSKLAASLNNLSTILYSLGRQEDALKAVEESILIRRKLVSAQPEVFTSDLAGSLINLNNVLSSLGRQDDAMEAAQEAVELYRALAQIQPETFTPTLALILINLGPTLSDLEQYEEALQVAEEAVTILRELVRSRREAFTPNLALSLSNISIIFSRLGRRENALDAAKEATSLYRALARALPEAFATELARSLKNLANVLSLLGRREAALEAAEEAVELHRQLVGTRPEVFTPELAGLLNNLSNALSDLSRFEEALKAIEEAVSISRELARTRPAVFMQKLAASLYTLSNRLSDVGRREDALEAVTEAAALYRELAQAQPQAFRPDLALSLFGLGNRLSELGMHEDVCNVVGEAISIWRQLVCSQPETFTHKLALSLNTLANGLFGLGRRKDALKAAEEATNLHRQLVRALPEVFKPDLARSLNNFGIILSAIGRLEDAVKALEEAKDLFIELARAQPQVFSKNLFEVMLNLADKLSAVGRSQDADVVRENIKKWFGDGNRN